MIKTFAMPDVGEGLTEAEIVRWHVAEGDEVEINAPLVEIETAKALVDLPCPFAGRIDTLLAGPGVVIPVGTPIVAINVGGDDDEAEPPGGATVAGELQDEPKREAVLVGYGVREASSRRRPRREPVVVVTESIVVSEPMEVVATPVARTASNGSPVLAAPPVRMLARTLGIDLATVAATGPRGDVTRDDVRRAADPATARPASAPLAGERVAVRGVHRAMASAMVESAFTAPHVTEWVDVDVSRSMGLLVAMREHASFAGCRPTLLTVVAAAVAVAVRQHPRINSRWTDLPDGTAEIVVHDVLNLGFAADTPRGLMVPNVKGADRLGLPALAVEISRLTEAARSGALTPADLSGGTLTITNVGVFGVDGGTPILNPGEAAILAMGRVLERPWVVDGAVVARPVMELTLSFDHRVVDGALGSRFLAEVARILHDPAPALLLG